MSRPGRSRNASTGVFGSRRRSVVESMTLTADGVSKTSFSVRVAVTVTSLSEVIRFRAESARIESRADGVWAATTRAPAAAARKVKAANKPGLINCLRSRLPYECPRYANIRHHTELAFRTNTDWENHVAAGVLRTHQRATPGR